MGIFNFFKKSAFDKLSKNQQENSKLLSMVGIINQLIGLDLSASTEKKNTFFRYKREMESIMIPDEGLSLVDTCNNLISYLKEDENKYEALRRLSENEQKNFFEHLISFTFFDGSNEKQFTVETANYIGDIMRNLFPKKTDSEIKDLITSLIKKFSNSDILSTKTNKKLMRFSNGTIYMELEFKDGEKDILDGEFKEYYESGKLKTVGVYKDNLWHGRIKDYNENGILIADVMMKNGVENGEDISYNANGSIKQKSTKLDGKMNGLVTAYDEDGVLTIDQVYENGEATGKYRQYFNDGTISHEGQKINDEFSGELKCFYENGDIKATINYDTNLMRTFNPDGTLHTEKTLEG